MGKIRDIIIEKLQTHLHPTLLEVHDDSSKHAGHADAGDETHFRVIIHSSALMDLSRVAAHQRIYQILEDELKTTVHALAIQLRPPQ
jgi:BolA protein